MSLYYWNLPRASWQLYFLFPVSCVQYKTASFRRISQTTRKQQQLRRSSVQLGPEVLMDVELHYYRASELARLLALFS